MDPGDGVKGPFFDPLTPSPGSIYLVSPNIMRAPLDCGKIGEAT